jgi:ABC-type cobalamin/Fe3+-siderophores transport system ATPase subunit
MTAIVGANGSGKSAILRFFYDFRSLFADLARMQQGMLLGQPQSWSIPLGPGAGIYDRREIFHDRNEAPLRIHVSFKEAPPTQIGALELTLGRAEQHYTVAPFADNKSILERGITSWTANDELTTADGVNYGWVQAQRDLTELASTLYIGAFRNILNVGTQQSYFDIQTGEAFVQSWRSFKNGPDQAMNQATQRVTRDVKNIFRLESLEIVDYVDGTTLQLYIDDKSYKLPAVGSGMAQFILTLANAATKAPAFILIDEPELNLHPSLQLDFLTALASYASRGIIFGTHSIGLARAAADRLYALTRVDRSSRLTVFEATSSLSELLGELNYSGYRALGYDTVVLVEGRTEVRTFQQFLRAHKLDHQVVLLPMGGGEMINAVSLEELRELARLSDHVFAVIDSERAAATDVLSADRQAFVANCLTAGITCKVLDRRATENYFTSRAVKATRGASYDALQPFERLKDAARPWPKTENWRIAREMNIGEIVGTDLGAFLRELSDSIAPSDPH